MTSERMHLIKCMLYNYIGFFFFQAEDGIRDVAVTGVQTCALPISQDARGASACGFPLRLQSDRCLHDQKISEAGAFRPRSEERRVGKEGRSRWSPYH